MTMIIIISPMPWSWITLSKNAIITNTNWKCEHCTHWTHVLVTKQPVEQDKSALPFGCHRYGNRLIGTAISALDIWRWTTKVPKLIWWWSRKRHRNLSGAEMDMYRNGLPRGPKCDRYRMRPTTAEHGKTHGEGVNI